MICLRNEVIFIFLNRQKMNDPKTHGFIMRVMEIITNISFTGPSDYPKKNLALPISKLL